MTLVATVTEIQLYLRTIVVYSNTNVLVLQYTAQGTCGLAVVLEASASAGQRRARASHVFVRVPADEPQLHIGGRLSPRSSLG